MTTIVFVDENTTELNALGQWFSETNPTWQVHFSHSVEQVVALIDEQRIDCIVGDLCIPAVNGIDLFSHVAQHQPDTVRIALSYNTDAELTLESMHAIHRFIAKPDSAEGINQAITRSLQLRAQLHDPALRTLITGITSLPILPEIYDRLMLELASDDFSTAVVSRIIESDISLSATLLKVVNSPYYGLVQHVESASHAVNLLGIEVVKNILLSENVVNQFKQFSPGASRVAELNLQASIRSVLANRFARIAKLPKRQIDHCNMSGMLSALGELVVETRMIDRAALDNEQYHHDAIGSSILGLWSLPDAIVEAVLHQNDTAVAATDVSPLTVLQAIRKLEQTFEDNNFQMDETFDPQIIFADYPLDQALLETWFDCFCDYHLDLKQAA